jgi:hypothetical protein
MAGFRDDPTGMVVMVDVGALPPGNYTVGISDPSVVGGAALTGPSAISPDAQLPAQPAPPLTPAPNNGNEVVPKKALPAPGGTGREQGNTPPASKLRSSTILAQVGANNAPASVESSTDDTNLSPPPIGTNPTNSTPSEPPRVSNPQPSQAGAGPIANNSGGGVGTLSQIGTITIDQSGTGRMQQKVEGVHVRNVVGQAIVLYSHGTSPQTLPANLNGTAAAATRQGVIDSSRGASGTNVGQGTAAAQQPTPASRVPVAGGIIQLVNDRRPPAATTPTTAQPTPGTGAAIEQPATATPPTGQNLVR